MPRSDGRIALLLALSASAVYLVSGFGHPTPYDYFTRLAEAFLDGRWWLTEVPPWLNELLACGEGRWCLPYPPMPALVVAPFLLVFREGLAQTVASAFAGGLAAAPTYLAVRRLGAPPSLAVGTTLLAAFGTTLWFTASDGRSWYIAHSVAVLFASLALLAALDGRPAWVVGALLGAATLARIPVGLAAPGLLLLVARRRGEPLARVAVPMAIGLAPFALLELGYDVLRWGAPLELGYARLIQGDPLFPYGLLSPAYLPRHLYAILFQAPDFVDGTPLFVRPSWIGVSLTLTSPALAWALVPLRRWRAHLAVLPLLLAAALPLVPDVLHGTVGFAQFGYRFSLDAQPFLVPLVALGAAWSGSGWTVPRRLFLIAAAWSVLANLYGVVALIQLGHVQ